MTQQEKKEGKVLLNILKNYHRHYTAKVNRFVTGNKYQEGQKLYCAGAKFGLQLAFELVEVFLKGRLKKALERMEYYGEDK